MTTAPLPPYSGPNTTCPKCGHKGATAGYLGHGECVHGRRNEVIGFSPNERLHRECWGCDYAWDEAISPALSVEPTRQQLIDAADRTRRVADRIALLSPWGHSAAQQIRDALDTSKERP